jgi:hypothetical protein
VSTVTVCSLHVILWGPTAVLRHCELQY